jgi:taurine dioxygenase
VHPVTGRRALFVNPFFTARINELAEAESRALLAFLYEHQIRPEFQVRFRWQKDSVAFWDNRGAQHTALWDYFPNTRSGYRVTIQGDRPVGPARARAA